MATNSGIAGAAASARIPVMIVDDQPETRLGLALMVRRDPGLAIVLEAEDGRQAIDRIERAEELGRDLPRVVLMDVRMPVLDGIDATAAITRRWPGVRVLMLTTYDEDDLDWQHLFGRFREGQPRLSELDRRHVAQRRVDPEVVVPVHVVRELGP